MYDIWLIDFMYQGIIAIQPRKQTIIVRMQTVMILVVMCVRMYIYTHIYFFSYEHMDLG